MSIDLKATSIVIAEANAASRGVLVSMITRAGDRVAAQASGAHEALGAIKRSKPTIAIIDLQLFESEASPSLSALFEGLSDTAIVAMGPGDDKELAAKAFKLGALGYLAKPFNEAHVLRVLTQVNAIMARRAAVTPGGDAPAGTPRAVIIDRDHEARNLLRSILERGGFQVVAEADSGMEGLLAVDGNPTDFVCLAVDLPEIDGLNTLSCLRATHPKLPIFMVTAHADRETVAQALQRGVRDYIIKPFDPERIILSVTRAFSA